MQRGPEHKMDRSVSPLYLHVSRKTPVHVHLRPRKRSPKRHTESERKRLDRSFAEMAAGRPSLRATSTVSRMKASDWAKASNSRGPWVPPPARSTKPRMTWEGPTHRLEINPPDSGDTRNGTVLRMSDLTPSSADTTDIVLEEGEEGYESKVDALASKFGALKAEVDRQRSLRDLEDKEAELRESRASLREKEVELQTFREELLESEREKLKLKSSVAMMKEDMASSRSVPDVPDTQRERLLRKLVEVEMDSSAATRQAEGLRDSLKKLQKDRHFSSSAYASEVAEQKDLLLERLAEFDTSNKALRRLIRSQQGQESSAKHLAQRLAESEATSHLLQSQLEEKEKLAMHSQELHDEVSQRETELQSMSVRIQSLEEQLHQRDLECVELEGGIQELKRKAQRDKDALKRATRKHKDRATHSEQTVEALGNQLEDANGELEQVRGRLNKSMREKIKHEAEISTLTMRVKDLQEALTQSKITIQSSLDSVSARLTEKTHELNTAQLETDRLKARASSLEGQLKALGNTSQARTSTLESEVAQLQASVTQYEGLVAEYKTQLEKSRKECEDLARELRRKDQEVERARQESQMEVERFRLKLQQQLSELEPMPHLLKTTEANLKEAQERLVAHESRATEQSRVIADLTAKVEQHSAAAESMRDKWHEVMAESKALSVRVEAAERRVQDSDQQNRELVAISGKKEESIQRLQHRVEELLQEVASLTAQMETSRGESRRHVEQIKDRAASKERANLARIADLESQLSRSSGLATQMRKSKEDTERRFQSRLHELQDKLEHANSTKRSMENYVNFLKSSYASVFNEPGTTTSPFSPLLH